jgi:DNA-binding NarL/FixJ family response regulator
MAAPPLSAEVRTEARSDRALEIIRRGGVHLVLCDVRAEPVTGRELAQALHDIDPVVPIILLGDHDDCQWLTAAVASGAAGVFTKDASLDEFLVGVQAVLSGHRAIGAAVISELLDRVAEQPTRVSGQVAGSHLSRTELEILALIGQAESIPAIAASRGISHKTVRNHLAKIYRKLDLHGRTEAMLWAARMGLAAATTTESGGM